MTLLLAWLRSALQRKPGLERIASPVDRPVTLEEARAAKGEMLLGNQALRSGRLDQAEHHLRAALTLDPGLAEAHANLGALQRDLGKLHEAEHELQRAVELKPDLGPACFNLAMIYLDRSWWSKAAELLRRSLASEPAQADAQYWLGNALMGMGDATGARAAYLAAIRLQPSYVQARWGQVMAQLPAVPQDEEEARQAVAAFASELGKAATWFRNHRAVKGYPAVGAQKPFYLAYVDGNHRELLAAYGALCSELMASWAKQAGVSPTPGGSGGAKCRVGIVSAHVHSHSVWHALLRGWVEHLDRDRFDLNLFYTGSKQDAETQWAAREVTHFHQGNRDWTDWARVISDSRLDIIIYPEVGLHPTSTRLSALRLAPVQLASWGHPLTTGLPTIDGYISAEAFEPQGSAAHYTERLLALPRLGCCYQPFGTRPSKLDFLSWGIGPEDRVLLCAGTPYKYSPADDRVLVDLAKRCRPCKLVFFRGTDEGLAALLEKRLQKAFASADVSYDESVRFIPWQPQAAFFALLDRADVYLDTIGFSGFNTAMQAIERGTPVVAYEGGYMRGRFASAILRQLGLDEWVATSVDQYVSLVERILSDEGLRRLVRQQISERRLRLFGDLDTVTALEDTLLALRR